MELAKALRDHNRENEAIERNLAAASIVDKLKASLAPPGTFYIPMLLKERRNKYLIPNGAFELFPLFRHALVDAARLANQAAGIVVGKFGPATVTIDELRRP